MHVHVYNTETKKYFTYISINFTTLTKKKNNTPLYL